MKDKNDNKKYLDEILRNRSLLIRIVDSICLEPEVTRSFFNEYKCACHDLNTSKKRQFEFLENYMSITVDNIRKYRWMSVNAYNLCMHSDQKQTYVNESVLIDDLKKKGMEINGHQKDFSSENYIIGKNGKKIDENTFYTSWKENDSAIKKAYEKKTSLMEKLIDKVNRYSDKTEKSLAKKNVMEALSKFLRAPSPDSLECLKETTKKNKGWDSGFFSEVRRTHDQIVNMHIKSGLK